MEYDEDDDEEDAAEEEGGAALLVGMGDMGGLTGGGDATAVPARHEVCCRIHVDVVGVVVGAGVADDVWAGVDPRPNPVKPKNPPPVPIGLISLTGVVGEVLLGVK